MAVTVTGIDVIRRVIETAGLGLYIPADQIDAIAASSLQSVFWFRNRNWGSNQFLSEDAVIYRPSANNQTEYVRYAADLNSETGVIEPDTAWADVDKTDEVFFLLFNGVHPMWIVDALNRALGKCYFENTEPLSAKPAGSILADAGFQNSGTTSYTESDADGGAATTFSKVTDDNGENVYGGLAAGRVLNAGAGGYIRQRFSVTGQEPVMVHALSRLASGTQAQIALRDVTQSADVGEAVGHAEGAWQWIRRYETVPSGCKVLEVRWQGVGASDDIYLGGHCVLFPDQARVRLDTKWDTAHKVPSLVSARPRGRSDTANVYPALATEYEEIPRSDYDFLFERPGSNPYAVQFHRQSQHEWFKYPVLIQGRRAYSDLTTMTIALSETTSSDLDLLEAATRVELFQDSRVSTRVPDAETKLADAYGAWLSVNGQFEQKGPAKRGQDFSFPRAAN